MDRKVRKLDSEKKRRESFSCDVIESRRHWDAGGGKTKIKEGPQMSLV